MLCCIRRTKPVEKNEEADQEIKQDEKKPEDKAHKAATKIQASFRGHILRKKMKDGEEDEEASPAVPEEAAKEAADGEEEKKEDVPPATEQAAEEKDPTDVKEEETSQAKSPISEKPANSPAPVATSPVAAATSPVAAAASPTAAPSEPPKEEAKAEPSNTKEKPKEVDSSEAPVSAQNPSTDCAEKSVEGGAAQEESKQADVPAATVSETADKEEPHQTQDKKGRPYCNPASEMPIHVDELRNRLQTQHKPNRLHNTSNNTFIINNTIVCEPNVQNDIMSRCYS
uniref:Neuromodulin n=1 Tax=Salmo trutta TaxID=8032 RepID=A0A674C4I9_SALTR